jgi:hypothetical protein
LSKILFSFSTNIFPNGSDSWIFSKKTVKAEERKKPPITYHCKWCNKILRGGHNSDANLKKHHDGSNQAGCGVSGCPKQHLAIHKGANLPPTANKTKALLKQNNNNGKLTSFFGSTEKFNPKVLNQIISVWKL